MRTQSDQTGFSGTGMLSGGAASSASLSNRVMSSAGRTSGFHDATVRGIAGPTTASETESNHAVPSPECSTPNTTCVAPESTGNSIS